MRQTLKRRAAVTGLCVGVLTATGDVLLMTVPMRERLNFGLVSGVQLGWVTYVCLSAPQQGGRRRAALLMVAGVAAAWVVSVLTWNLV